jgi:hypothetical protein
VVETVKETASADDRNWDAAKMLNATDFENAIAMVDEAGKIICTG